MQDQRLVTRLQNYWELIRRGKPMPDIVQFNTATIDDMWQQCTKLELTRQQEGVSFHCKFMGEQTAQIIGRNLAGTMVDRRVTQYPLNVMVKPLDGVAESGQFAIDENQFVNSRSRVVKYRACFMPFGNEAKGVTHIIIGFSGREF